MAEGAAVSQPESDAGRWVALDALRATLGRPPVWGVVWVMELLLALAPAVVFASWMQGATEHRYEPRSLIGNLDTVFRFDQRAAMALVDDATARIGALLALLAMLVGCFSAGGWLQVFLERTRGHSLQRFFLGGARYFWRFFRLMLVTIGSLAFAGWVVYGTPWNELVLGWLFDVPTSDFGRLESLASEDVAVRLRWTQHALYALLVGSIFVWGDYARTRLALYDTSSAVWAGLCTWFTLGRHPLATLGPCLALFAVELALVWAGGTLARSVEARIPGRPDLLGVALLLAIGQLVLLWRVVLRGARYHAAVKVSKRVVHPIARPDPWKEGIGPPAGGPRYPLGGDEYGVSM